jgi:predicted nuclease with TOPRIM domain
MVGNDVVTDGVDRMGQLTIQEIREFREATPQEVLELKGQIAALCKRAFHRKRAYNRLSEALERVKRERANLKQENEALLSLVAHYREQWTLEKERTGVREDLKRGLFDKLLGRK